MYKPGLHPPRRADATGEETMANAFRKPIGPSARAYIGAEIVEETKIKTELARAGSGANGIDGSKGGFIAPRGLLKTLRNIRRVEGRSALIATTATDNAVKRRKRDRTISGV